MASLPTNALISHGLATPTVVDAPAGKNPKIWAAAQDFEAVFLESMFAQMFTGLGDEGPFGGGSSVEAWRGMMVQEWSKSISAAGGIGIADQVYGEILALQENRA